MVYFGPAGSAIIGGAFTLLAVVIGQFLFHYWKLRRKRARMKSALLTEMNIIHGNIERWWADSSKKAFPRLQEEAEFSNYPTPVFDEYVGSLGLLSESEIDPIVQFYSYLKQDEWIISRTLEDEEALRQLGDEDMIKKRLDMHNFRQVANYAIGKLETSE